MHLSFGSLGYSTRHSREAHPNFERRNWFWIWTAGTYEHASCLNPRPALILNHNFPLYSDQLCFPLASPFIVHISWLYPPSESITVLGPLVMTIAFVPKTLAYCSIHLQYILYTKVNRRQMHNKGNQNLWLEFTARAGHVFSGVERRAPKYVEWLATDFPSTPFVANSH